MPPVVFRVGVWISTLLSVVVLPIAPALVTEVAVSNIDGASTFAPALFEMVPVPVAVRVTEAVPAIALLFVRPVAVRLTAPPDRLPLTARVPVEVKSKLFRTLDAPRFVLPVWFM